MEGAVGMLLHNVEVGWQADGRWVVRKAGTVVHTADTSEAAWQWANRNVQCGCNLCLKWPRG